MTVVLPDHRRSPEGGAGAGDFAPRPCSRSQNASLPPYDPGPRHSRLSWKTRWIITPPRLLLALLRALPILPLPWKLVARRDEVVEVLSRPDVFAVWSCSEIARLNDGGNGKGTPFILGIDDRTEHDDQVRSLMQVFRREDVAGIVKDVASQEALERVWPFSQGSRQGEAFDAVTELITQVPLAICTRYYGIRIKGDDLVFADATFTTSGYLFSYPQKKRDPKVERATDYFRHIVEDSICAEMASGSTSSDTIVARMVRTARTRDGNVSDADFRFIRAILMGMIVGFVPTNTMAGGHILEVLLNDDKAMKAARSAALAGDDALLERCLMEALRFMPINAGPFRVCKVDHVLAAGTPRAQTIRAGTTVWALTLSAMFDPEQVSNPTLFDPSRAASDALHFGYGLHTCVGLYIARAHLTQVFKVMLRQPGLNRHDGAKMKVRGAFPTQLMVDFVPPR